jgi:signal transduction histidine kinase
MPFVSDQCVNVLVFRVDTLRENPALFEEIILWKDRKSCDPGAIRGRPRYVELGRPLVDRIVSRCKVGQSSSEPSQREERRVIWEGIIINITQSRQRETELKESHERLKEMSSHIMAAREHERISIAREIHDDLGGNLAAIKIDLDWLARNSGAGGMENNALIAKIHTVSQMVDRTIDSIQRISRDLRPGIMDFGIAAAIEWEAGRI